MSEFDLQALLGLKQVTEYKIVKPNNDRTKVISTDDTIFTIKHLEKAAAKKLIEFDGNTIKVNDGVRTFIGNGRVSGVTFFTDKPEDESDSDHGF